jgi:hypothetical protein
VAKPGQERGKEAIDRHISTTPRLDRDEQDGRDGGDKTGGGDESSGVSSGVRSEVSWEP